MKKIILLALAGVLAFSTAAGAELATLYTARVPNDQSQDDPRAYAYEMALAQVLLRVSGNEVVDDVVLFDQLFPDPAAYVVQFRPGPDETLFVSFDGEAIETNLRQAGQRVWGADRPLTLVWLAVDWGLGDREIIGAADTVADDDQSRPTNRNLKLRERVLEIADRRGLPVAFPLLDGEDLAAVSFSDLWGGFDERALEASRRYDANSILIGRVRGSGTSQNRWTYYFGDQQRSWSGEPETVVSRIAELLAAEFSIGGDEPLRSVQLHVSGILSLDAFGELQRMLGDQDAIDSFAIAEVSADRVSYRVSVHGGAQRLAKALRFAGLIEQERIDMSDFGIDEPLSSLEFFFSP